MMMRYVGVGRLVVDGTRETATTGVFKAVSQGNASVVPVRQVERPDT
jgi:hypothetical protein